MENSEVTEKPLQVQLAEVMALISEAKDEIAPLTETRKEVDRKSREDREETAAETYRLQQEIYRKQQELNEREHQRQAEAAALREKEWDLQQQIRKAQMLADSLQRQIDQARRAELAAAEWATLEKRWDQLTMGAPWREWAKDHQLDGARKITYEGRMILGDTMGLGKTLTSLIALDMIEAATKDASPDNPIEFGSMK